MTFSASVGCVEDDAMKQATESSSLLGYGDFCVLALRSEIGYQVLKVESALYALSGHLHHQHMNIGVAVIAPTAFMR